MLHTLQQCWLKLCRSKQCRLTRCWRASTLLLLGAVMIASLFSLGATTMGMILRVAFQPDLPPYQFLDVGGKAVGAHVDILDSIAKRYNMEIEYIPMDTTTACLNALEAGEVDVVLGIHAGIRAREGVRLTTVISQSQVCLIAPNDRVSAIRQNLGTGYLKTAFENSLVEYFSLRNFRNLHSQVVSNQRETLLLLLRREVDMVVGVKNSLVYQLQRAGVEQNYTIINNYLVPIEYSMAVRATDSALLHQLNDGINHVRITGAYAQIHESWIEPESAHLREIVRKAVYGVLGISIVTGAIILINLRVNSVLKRQINLRTQELREANTLLQNQVIETRNMSELRNQIIEDNPNGIIVFDTNFIITACNYNACKIIGVEEPPIGSSIFDVELLHSMVERKRGQWFASESDLNMDDLTTRDENGETVIYRCDIRRLHLADGSVRGIILSIKNVTRERKNRELFYERERNRALNQMVAGIAHEIRNPLTSIKTFVELIPKKKDSPLFLDQMSRYLPDELGRIDAMIRNLIDYAKPQSTKRQPVLVSELLTSCLSLMRYSISPNIELRLDAEDDLYIEANPSQIRQIMINLILNAAEAMEGKLGTGTPADRLKLHVSAVSQGSEVVITVRDEGCGMQADEINRACEPYFTTKPQGTGLGLAISKQYTEENGGTLSIVSEKDKFTEVTLRFRRYEV